MKKTIAILFILTLISCDFRSSDYYDKEAGKLENVGKYKDAIILLNKAIEKDPKNISALMNRAVDKSLLKDYKGAINDYSKILEIDTANTLVLLNRGKNRKRLKDYQGAIVDFEKAIATKGGENLWMDEVENSFLETDFESDVKMEEIRLERGIAMYQIDSLYKAFEDFNFCIERNLEISTCYYWRGLIHMRNNKKENAYKDLLKSAKLGDKDAQEIIEKQLNK